MTAVATATDFVFVCQFQMKENYQNSLKGLIVPCFFTTLTTMVGFLSLNSSDLALIKRFGNGAALGAFLEWMMIFLFLPAVLKILRKEKIWVNPKKSWDFKWLDKLEAFTLPKPMIKVFLLLMILSIPSYFFLNDQDSPVENLPKHHPLRLGYEIFTDKFGWQGQVHLYFPALPKDEDYGRIINSVTQFTNVYKVEDPQELVRNWIKDFPILKQELIKRELSYSPLWEKYYSHTGTLRVPLYLKEQDLSSMRKLRDYVTGVCAGVCRLAGQRVVYLEYGEKISITMIESFAVSIILVIIILAYLLWVVGKLQHILPVVISSLMGPLIILTLMAIFQIQMTVITSIFLAVMVGLAGDNAIQYFMTNDEDLIKGIENRARGSIIVTLIMILASSVFLLQTLRPMKILGLLFVMGFSINLIGDLFGLKGLIREKHSRKEQIR
jgi:predicted RND superfamily exporter protein